MVQAPDSFFAPSLQSGPSLPQKDTFGNQIRREFQLSTDYTDSI